MKIIQKSKKFFVLALSALVLSSLFVIGGASTTANAATTAPVEFYYSYYNHYYIGGYYTTFIKINTVGSDQHVYLHVHEDEEWKDIEGEYVTTLSDGSQIWKVYNSYIGSGREYAIKYEVDGQTYWDNNNNQNYTTENNFIGIAVMGVNPAFGGTTVAENYPVRVLVKNLAYDKVVNLRYTEDDWLTYKELPLNYIATNTDGSEYWATTLKLNPNAINNFHYAISYTVNGRTYWDNNFGSNYNF